MGRFLPERLIAGLSRRVAGRLSARGRPDTAGAVLHGAARLVRRGKFRRLRADLMGEAAELELSRGQVPRHLVAAYAAELACADAAYAKKKAPEAAESLFKAMNLAFHRMPHFDVLTSPLVTDLKGFLAPLHGSTAVQALGAPRGRNREVPPRAKGERLRLLIVTYELVHFLPLIRAHYESHPDVEMRFIDLAADESFSRLSLGSKRIMEAALGGQARYRERVEEELRPHLDWADTVFVEWCTIPPGFLSLVDPGSTRIVVRLHSYEAFTRWPHMIDFSRIDDIIFVADHVRDLVTEMVPRLSPGGPRSHVIQCAMDLAAFKREKAAEARFTLGLVGVGQIAKDPCWAFEVLRLLRARDNRYRLLLVGNEFSPESSAGARVYHDRYTRELAELEACGAVRRMGQRDDVPAVLTEVGVILSTSVREGVHCALIEGAASGAVPVVRDWPFFAGRPTGARTLFPAEWVIDSPSEAAERILAVTGNEETWQKTGEMAAEHALRTWDWTVVQHDFDRLLLPGQAPDIGEDHR